MMMYKWIVYSLCLLSFVAARPGSAGQNLIANPEFQAGADTVPHGWQIARGWKGETEYEFADACCRLFRKDDDQGAGACFSLPIPVEAGKRYDLSAEMKIEAVDGKYKILVDFLGGDGKLLQRQKQFRCKEDTDGKFIKQQVQVEIPEGVTAVQLGLVINRRGKVSFRKLHFAEFEPMHEESKVAEAPMSQDPFNLLANADFSDLVEGLPRFWSVHNDWRDSSLYRYRFVSGALEVSGGEADEHTAAFARDPVPITGGGWYQLSVQVRTINLRRYASATVQFIDKTGEIIESRRLISFWREYPGFVRRHHVFQAPDNAVKVAILAQISGPGTAFFKDFTLNGNMSDRDSNLQTANLLLNASFEEADFVPELVDCYSVVHGTAKRSSQPDHGTYALTLSPAAILYFGKPEPSISVSGNTTLHGHVAVLGTGNLRFQMDFFTCDLEPLPSQERQFSAKGEAHYSSHKFTITVPQNAEFAAVSWHSSQDSEVTLDTVYLGEEAYSEEKMPDSMPALERCFPQPADVDKLPASTIGDFQGIPTWHIDSQPIVNSLYTVERMRPTSSPDSFKYHKNVIAEGRFPIYIVGSPISINEEGFRGIDAALKNLDFQVRLVLSECPDARFLVWCHQYVSEEFIRNYPDELAKVEDDSCGFIRPLKAGYSYGSEIWGRMAAQGLEKFISRATKESYGERIVGIIPGFGQYGENNWGHIDGKYYTSPHDFSPAMKNFFRKWLFREYQADVQAFCKAWQRPNFNFANAQVPTQLQRVPRLKGAFLDPEKQRQVIDYARCDSYSILHRVLQQCKAVKEVSQGKLFTMSEIGYLALRYNHREMQAALRSPYLDAWGPAPGYTNRGPGDDIPDNAPVASLKHAGKVWMFQADVRSHLAGSHLKRFGDTANADESVAVYLRDMGHYMTGGAIPYHWTFNTWYRDEKVMSVVRKFDFLMQLSSHFPRHSTAEVALVLDPLSLSTGIEYNYNRRPETAADQISRNRSLEWHKLGAPYDYWVLDDLLESKQLQQYKVVIMGAICTLTGKQRQLIQERLYRDGRTVIWMYAPGIIRADGTQLSWDLQNMDISGFSLAEDSGSRPLAINLTEPACHRYNIQSEELPLGNFKSLIYGGFGSNPENPKPLPPEKMAARYHVEGLQGIEILGVYADQPLVAAAQRKFAHYTSIFWGSTALDHLFLRPVLREAGVHLYSDRPAVVYANQHFLMLHSSQDGEHQIELPQTAEIVYDLYEEKLLASRASSLKVKMEASRTLLLYYGPEVELDQARLQINKNREEREKANQGMLSQYAFDPVLRNLSRPAVPDQSYSPDSQGFIRHWLFAGPFPNHGDNEGFEQDFLNTEEEVRPQTGQNFTATFAANPKTEKLAAQSWFKGHAGEKTLNFSWKALEFSEGITTNIAQQMDLPFKDRIVYYCVCYVKSPVAQEALLSTGSDDGHKTFFNGQLAMSIDVRSRSLIPDSEQAPVQLKEGTNTLLIKVIQGVGGLGHAVRFLDPVSKKPITDLQVTLQP